MGCPTTALPRASTYPSLDLIILPLSSIKTVLQEYQWLNVLFLPEEYRPAERKDSYYVVKCFYIHLFTSAEV